MEHVWGLRPSLPFRPGGLYDAGESANSGTLAVLDPSGNIFNDGECRIYSRSNPSVAWNLQGTVSSGSNCQETVTPGEYNGRWLKFEMDLPAAYSCSTVGGG